MDNHNIMLNLMNCLDGIKKLEQVVYGSIRDWNVKLKEVHEYQIKEISGIKNDILGLQPTRNPYVSDINKQVLDLLDYNKQLMLEILRKYETVDKRLDDIDKGINTLDRNILVLAQMSGRRNGYVTVVKKDE